MRKLLKNITLMLQRIRRTWFPTAEEKEHDGYNYAIGEVMGSLFAGERDRIIERLYALTYESSDPFDKGIQRALFEIRRG